MPKTKEPQVIITSHVRELAEARGWDLSRLAREGYYQHGLALNTVKKAWKGSGALNQSAVIKFARLFGCSDPYREVVEVRLS